MTYFVCPLCGASFEVKDERSERIFCGHHCKQLDKSLSAKSEAKP